MQWVTSKKDDNLIMIYGFRDDKRCFSTVLILHKKDDFTTIYGFLTKVRITRKEFMELKKCLKDTIETNLLQIEVLPEYLEVYKNVLHSTENRSSKTFNGLDSVILITKKEDL
jgi:hypothetical protein